MYHMSDIIVCLMLLIILVHLNFSNHTAFLRLNDLSSHLFYFVVTHDTIKIGFFVLLVTALETAVPFLSPRLR